MLLDQRGLKGEVAQLLEGPSARLPAGWGFTDLQLELDECFRVSASDLSVFDDCWELLLQNAARNLVGLPRHWRSVQGPALTEMRRELPPWHAGVLPRPPMERHGAPGARCCGYETMWQLPNSCTGRSLRRGLCPAGSPETSSALLRPFSRIEQCWLAPPSHTLV